MPISYSASFYTNPTIMRAEEVILDRFEHDWTPMTFDALMKLTGEGHRTVEKALTFIRRHEGYSVDVKKRNGITTYQVIYDETKDPWKKHFAYCEYNRSQTLQMNGRV